MKEILLTQADSLNYMMGRNHTPLSLLINVKKPIQLNKHCNLKNGLVSE